MRAAVLRLQLTALASTCRTSGVDDTTGPSDDGGCEGRLTERPGPGAEQHGAHRHLPRPAAGHDAASSTHSASRASPVQ